MEDMGFSSAFNVQLHVPALKEADVQAVLSSLSAFSAADVSPALLPFLAMKPLKRHRTMCMKLFVASMGLLCGVALNKTQISVSACKALLVRC